MVVIDEVGSSGLLILHVVVCNTVPLIVGSIPDHPQIEGGVVVIRIRRHHRRRGERARSLRNVCHRDRHGLRIGAVAAAVLNRHLHLVAPFRLLVQRGLGDELSGRGVNVERRRVGAAETVGQGVAELDFVVVFPVFVGVGGRDGGTDVNARGRVFRNFSVVSTGVPRGIGRVDHVVRREQDSQAGRASTSANAAAKVMTGMYCLIDSPIWTLNEAVPALPPTRVTSLPPEMPYSIRLPSYPHIMSIEIRVSYPAIAPCLSPPSPPPTSSNLTITAEMQQNATKCNNTEMFRIPPVLRVFPLLG